LHIGISDVDQVTDEHEFRKRFILTFWSQATDLEKLISLQLESSVPQTADMVLSRLGDIQSAIRASEVEEALAYLELYTIARATVEGYVLRTPVFRHYLSIVSQGLVAEWQQEIAAKVRQA
jgi:hypothetical protein